MALHHTSLTRRALVLSIPLAGLATALVGCNANNPKPGATSSSAAGSATSAAPASKGGTLRILTSSSAVNWDPAISQSLAITSLGLVQRRLTAWKVGSDGVTKVVPDLATDTGQVSADGKTWTFTLKDGLAFEDGNPITAADVKYSVERSFAPQLSGGLGYHKALLVGASDYSGPYDGKQLASVEAKDDKTLVFHLNSAYGDWPWIVSMPAFSAVPKAKDNVKTYTTTPVATGPYRVSKTVEGTSITLERNEHWDPKTDEARGGGPDSIIFQLGQDATVAAQRLIADSGDDQFAFGASFVPAAQLAQVQTSAAKDRLVTSGPGALAYLAINTQAKGLDDVKVRKAISLAVDRNAYRVAVGGEIAGEFADTLITPGIPGRKQYASLLKDVAPAGDPEQAKKLLAEAKWSGRTLKFAIADDAVSSAKAEAIQQGLKRAGLTVTIVPLADDVLTEATTQGDGSKYDLTLSSWQPDFPSANGNIQPLFASDQIGKGGYNISRYSNPKADELIKKATETTDPKESGAIWAQADELINADAPVVPLIYTKNSFLHGSKVVGFAIPAFPAYPNYLTVSVAK
ncbi:ABC transporter substrate-binding protein [Aestuariimicrobium sp. T2.26MG-19.2B]|uniref:ABC transporter substrate-binding protein n=1 Tax=Aestuariimicrobium sp. T2.26MG-19.2B TaxID=3040679 RepID=UPI002477359E|nr:ABC transporter substrate-binding protein [Aestuariimicrobium sp. T2.26MG-19.2B]CAI9407310.1 Dipeptide-binding protein DppE [Aestuariimicrobium sp. T2.26MG-19.2B]